MEFWSLMYDDLSGGLSGILHQRYNLMFSWNPSSYALIGSVTLLRRFHLGIVFGGEV